MNRLLPIALGVVSAGFILFTGHISIEYVLDRYGGNQIWIVLPVSAIAIEVFGLVAMAELCKRNRFKDALIGIPFLGLAIIATVSFEIGKFTQVSSDSIASRQYEADRFKENREALSILRKKRDAALAKGWKKSATRYQSGINQLQKWAAGTSVSEIDPRATVINRYTGFNSSIINDGMTALIILFLLMGRILTPYWTYRLLPVSVNDPVNRSNGSELSTGIQQRHTDQHNWTAQSAVENFVKQNTQSVKGSRTNTTDLYRSYCIHAALNGLPWLQQRDFGEALGKLGFEKGRKPGNGAISYLDIELCEAA